MARVVRRLHFFLGALVMILITVSVTMKLTTRRQVAMFVAPQQNQKPMNSATKQWSREVKLHSGIKVVNVSKRSSAVPNIFSRENKHLKVPNIGSLQMSQEIRDFFDRVVFSNQTHTPGPPRPMIIKRARSRMLNISRVHQQDMERLMEEMRKLNMEIGINEDGILMVNNSQFQPVYDDAYNVNFDCARRGVVRKSLTKSKHSFLSPKSWYHGSYILALDFWEQKIPGIRNLLSLQCWAGHLGRNVEVVEPFIIGSKLGILLLNQSDSNQMKRVPLNFGDLYNRSAWNKLAPRYSKAKLARLTEWSKFTTLAPQSVILVTLFYGDLPASADCPMHTLNEHTRDFILAFDMEVISEVCINLKEVGPVTTTEFDTLVFGNHDINDTDVTVIFSQWRGVLNKKGLRVCLVDSPCAKGLGFSHFGSYLQPNKDVIADANTFIRLYYPNRLFTGVVIHIEKMVTSSSEGESTNALDIVKKCYVKILHDWSSLMKSTKSNSTFLSVDLDVYGNSIFSMHYFKPIHTNLSAETENITRSLLGRKMSSEKWGEILDTVASVDNPAYIGLMQTAIAMKSKCIILAGGGLLQELALQLYKRVHPKKEERCYIQRNQYCVRTARSIPNAY